MGSESDSCMKSNSRLIKQTCIIQSWAIDLKKKIIAILK